MTKNTLPIVPAYPESKIITRMTLDGYTRETSHGHDFQPGDVDAVLAAMLGKAGTEEGKADAARILSNKDPGYIAVWNDAEKDRVEEARKGIRALLYLVNGDSDLAVRVLSGEIAGEHRAIQTHAADVLLKAVRVVGERDANHFDARNECLRGLAERIANI